jgi:hypothetical protein
VILPVLLLLLLLFLLAQKIRADKFWSQIRRGVLPEVERSIATAVQTSSRIHTTVAEGVILANHLGAIHAAVTVKIAVVSIHSFGKSAIDPLRSYIRLNISLKLLQ